MVVLPDIVVLPFVLPQAPFSTVYLHGLVRDDKGCKLTKYFVVVLPNTGCTAFL